MKPELIVIKTASEVEALRDYLKQFDYIAIDCETTGLTKHDEVIGVSVCAEESKAYYIILKEWMSALEMLTSTGTETKIQVLHLLNDLINKNLIAHNAIYDCMMIESNFSISLIDSIHTDTMVLAHLLNENRRVALKELSAEAFGEDSIQEQAEMKASIEANGGLITKEKYELYKGDSALIGKYGAKDALLTFKLFIKMLPELYDQKLDAFFYDEESMPLLRGPTYQLNTIGMQVDNNYLQTLKRTLEAECLEAKAFIDQEIAPLIKDKYPATTKENVFNVEAPQQLAWLLFGKLSLEFGTLTDGGKNYCKSMNIKPPYTKYAKRQFIDTCLGNAGQVIQPAAIVNGKNVNAKKSKDPWAYIACDKTTLQKLAPKYKWIERLLEYKKKKKLLNTYVSGIEDGTRYGVIYPSFKQTGTTSGRYSSSNPNWQNLPREDKRIKKCISARPGKVLVGADYSQLEPRIFSSVSGDERLQAAFASGNDFYSVTGMETYDKLECVPLKEGPSNAFGVMYPKLRQDSKTFTLAATYGATGFQLAPMMGKSSDEAQRDIDNYFEKFPKVKQMMTDSHDEAKKNGFVLNHFGRPRRMPDAKNITKLFGNAPHAELPYEARSMLNLATNHRIQSTAASIVNRAMIKFYSYCKELNISAPILATVHDSIVVECDESLADTVSLLLRDAMENTNTLPGVALEAIPKIGINLAEV